MKERQYLFQSDRLGFRAWTEEDALKLHKINSDPQVMEFFPRTLTLDESEAFVHRMIAHQNEFGYCYFAVEKFDDAALIGFVGLCRQTYEAPFNPSTDIGWRLATRYWGRGYATEGALRCLKYAREALKLSQVVSVCSAINTKSEKVMQKIGMHYKGAFNHSKLHDYPNLQPCVWYSIDLFGK